MWGCKECNWKGESPVVIPAMSGVTVVDVIDIICPLCGGTVEFKGGQKLLNEWWDEWYRKNNQNEPPNSYTTKDMCNDYTMKWTDRDGVLRSHTEYNVTSKEHALSQAFGNCLINAYIIDYTSQFSNYFNVDYFLWTVNGKIAC